MNAVILRCREREKERERERERQTDREADRQTDRDRETNRNMIEEDCYGCQQRRHVCTCETDMLSDLCCQILKEPKHG